MTDLRYPIGAFKYEGELTEEERRRAIDAIAEAPARLRVAVEGLAPQQLETPYRPGGWTIRQVVHHLPDSHLHAYTRFKLALTEEEPTIKPYDEARWANLADAQNAPPDISLALLEALHQRWVLLLKSLRSADFGRTLRHPERGVMTLDEMLSLYATPGTGGTTSLTSPLCASASGGWAGDSIIRVHVVISSDERNLSSTKMQEKERFLSTGACPERSRGACPEQASVPSQRFADQTHRLSRGIGGSNL